MLKKKTTGKSLSFSFDQFPLFVLKSNNGWNDYGCYCTYNLYYYLNENEKHYIGEVKIISDELSTVDGDDTNKYIPDTFTALDNKFCSLGQNYSYYENLKFFFENRFSGILYALRDSAFFPDFHDAFEHNHNFKNSLIRFDEAEQLLRRAKHRIYGYKTDLFKFTYLFKANYSNENTPISFEFNNTSTDFNRIYAIIGKNGVGKTQLISSLPSNLANNIDNKFAPRPPLFSKIIAVSYSVFDTFNIPLKTATFNYHYCGVRKDKNNLMTDGELVHRFYKATQLITKAGRINKWRNILLTFINEDLLNVFLTPLENEHNDYQFDSNKFRLIKKQLSSGQSITLYIITEIVANIRYDSLILYDEPETHLHPNAITELMNTIYELVQEFQSYCVITTHSPLVIRELFSKNVYILERESNTATIQRVAMETFGENLSVLTEEIFGNKEIDKRHITILTKLVNSGKNFDEIKSLLQFDEIPLSLNVQILINVLINQRQKH